jgi:predicted metalloprotease
MRSRCATVIPIRVAPAPPAGDPQAKFVSQVLRSTEQVWTDVFRESGRTYQPPKLVLFQGSWPTACGQGQAAMGPFYCPNDQQVYIDLRFYKVLEQKLGAPGQFAQAYVVAHEVGHHVQRLLGYSEVVDRIRATKGEVEKNHASVRLELQADYLAGVWAHHAQQKFNYLDKGDVETALNAAQQIGDDTLQKRGRGRVVPDTFTHGTSKQRMRWFLEGFKTGDVGQAKLLFDLPYNEL